MSCLWESYAILPAPLAVIVAFVFAGSLVKRIKSHLPVLSYSHQRDCCDPVYVQNVCVHMRRFCMYSMCKRVLLKQLPHNEAVYSSETGQGHIALQALVNSTLIKGHCYKEKVTETKMRRFFLKDNNNNMMF